jgi:hypothetical protein
LNVVVTIFPDAVHGASEQSVVAVIFAEPLAPLNCGIAKGTVLAPLPMVTLLGG